MRNKYCKKINEVVVPWRRGSHAWKKMIQMREEVKHQFWWQLKSGDSWFWFDNWIGLGSLYHASGSDHWCDESYKSVSEMIENGTWNEALLRELLSGELADHIMNYISPPSDYLMRDKPWWMLESKGRFSVKSAWHYVRKRRT